MIRKTGVGILLSLVFVLFAYSSVLADTPVFKDGKWYGSINAGAMLLGDIDFGANLNYGGVLTVKYWCIRNSRRICKQNKNQT